MLQPRRKSTARRLPAWRIDIRRLKANILRIIIQKQMIQPRRPNILHRRRPLGRTLRPHITRNPSPGAKETTRRDLLVDLVHALVLDEAGVGAGRAEILELLVDDGDACGGEVVARAAEGDKIAGRGVANAVEAGGAGVACVGAGVVAGGPEDVVLLLAVVPDGGGGPGHAGCSCFYAVWLSAVDANLLGFLESSYVLSEGADQLTKSVDFQTTRPRLPCRVAQSQLKPEALISRSTKS